MLHMMEKKVSFYNRLIVIKNFENQREIPWQPSSTQYNIHNSRSHIHIRKEGTVGVNELYNQSL